MSGTSGILNVAGGALSAPTIVNNDQVNYSGGTIDRQRQQQRGSFNVAPAVRRAR